jgi:tetratricopeptide (TPR) repeat protein
VEAHDAAADRYRKRQVTVRIVLVLVVVAAAAHAGEPGDLVGQARAAYSRGDYIRARDLLVEAYRIAPRAELLFALGQVEFNLGNFKQAIDYYQRFKQTGPAPEQAALAEQAIGAARIELARPPPQPSRVLVRRWDSDDWAIAGFGGLAFAVAGGFAVRAYELDRDHTGSLRDYDHRLAQVRTAQLGVGVAASIGAVLATSAVLRWRLHLVDASIAVEPKPGGAAMLVGRSW